MLFKEFDCNRGVHFESPGGLDVVGNSEKKM